jgi:drug/metabolite transporter (DMT)-like permease
VSKPTNNVAIAGSLLLVVIMWGGNNVGTKWLVATWPPVWTGATRFLVAGFFLLGLLRVTNWLGEFQPLARGCYRQLWFRGGLSLAAYIVVFAWALKLTAASHVALYLGASPVWALLWEERPQRNWSSARRYGAALLAVSGVLVLFWPVLNTGHPTSLTGELCGLAASITWAIFNHQWRFLAGKIPGLEIAAHSMWMAGAWLLPFGLLEISWQGIPVDARHLLVQTFCIFIGGVVPYALWNNALRHWRTSQVMLFNNLIPFTTSIWGFFMLHEAITSTFCVALVLIILGVVIGQVDWAKLFKLPESF